MTGFATLFIGIIMYNKFLKEVQIRTLLFTAAFINCAAGVLNLLLVRGITLGMSPLAYYIITYTITDVVY